MSKVLHAIKDSKARSIMESRKLLIAQRTKDPSSSVMKADHQKLQRLVKLSLTPELLKPRYRKKVAAGVHPMTGHCYVASEALFHLLGGPGKSLLHPMFLWHERAPHWFLCSKYGHVSDLTVEQFNITPDYDLAVRKGFLTLEPSARAQEVIRRVRIALC